jgi:hypothetical protein
MSPEPARLALYGQFQLPQSGPTPEAASLIEARPPLTAHMRRVEAAAGG